MNKFSKKLILGWLLLTGLTATAQDTLNCSQVLLETDMGNIRVALYNETPRHRDNFLALVKRGFYDGLLFHRVIPNFMIQTGDSLSRNAPTGKLLGDGHYEKYKLPAEIHYPQLVHKRGALAAAREPDQTNPDKESSMCQFYIVYGRRFSNNMLDDVEERYARDYKLMIDIPEEVREVYRTLGGSPHLDTQYTVFGEVLEGIDVVRDIQNMERDDNDRPLIDLHIIRATVVKDIPQ